MAQLPQKWFQGLVPVVLFLVPALLLRATVQGPRRQPSAKAHVVSSSPPKAVWWQQCKRQTWSVLPGDYAIKLFKRHQMSTHALYDLLALDPLVKHTLTHLSPGMVLTVCVQDHALKTMAIPVDADHTLMLRQEKGHWHHWLHAVQPPQQDTFIKHFTLQHTFYTEAQHAGLSASTIANIHHILEDRIDFRKDLRRGDHFDVVLRAASHQKPTIMAVKYNHKGHTLAVMRYRNALGQTGYYTQTGHSVLRRFDRYPIHFKRISSPFRARRHHPILGYDRPHYGVDFAAPSGTPIYATASGKIHFVGRKHGYGNMIVIQHGRHYKTVYAHMSRFAKHMHSGVAVARHQLIGYVGMTGLATGPHCHYEFRINNKPKDPLHVRLPGAPALRGQDKNHFHERWASMQQEIVQA